MYLLNKTFRCLIQTMYPPWNEHSTWNTGVGRWVSFWDGLYPLFSGAMLVLGRVSWIRNFQFPSGFFEIFPRASLSNLFWDLVSYTVEIGRMNFSKIMMASFQMYVAVFGDLFFCRMTFRDVLPKMVGTMKLRQVSKILKAYQLPWEMIEGKAGENW